MEKSINLEKSENKIKKVENDIRQLINVINF